MTKFTQLIIVPMVIALLLCACAKEPVETEPTINLIAPTDSEYAADAQFWGDYVKSDLLPLWYQVSKHEIYLDVPDWNFEEYQETDVFHDGNCIIALTATTYADFTSLETVHSSITETFLDNIQDLVLLTSYESVDSETVNIHGMDILAVSGSIANGEEALSATSYTFVLDGVAMQILAVDISPDAQEVDISSLFAVAEAMMCSVRNTYQWNFLSDTGETSPASK